MDEDKKRLAAFMLAEGKSQGEVAEVIGVSQPVVSYWSRKDEEFQKLFERMKKGDFRKDYIFTEMEKIQERVPEVINKILDTGTENGKIKMIEILLRTKNKRPTAAIVEEYHEKNETEYPVGSEGEKFLNGEEETDGTESEES